MKKISIYLDTSIINFLFAEDAPEKQEITREFFENYVKKGVYEIFISPVVIDEINKTKDEEKKAKLLKVIKKHGLRVLDITDTLDEIVRLARIYIDNGIIPKKKMEDALHLAIGTVGEIDIFLSWNYRHLANINKERKITSINLLEGYTKGFRIITPMEVIYEED
jgi:predicted nucleic acid-binding protein